MAGFWRGFAKGWHSEMDRQQKQKMWEEEVALKREGMFLQLAPQYLKTSSRTATAGASGRSKDDDDVTTEAHEVSLLTNYGVSDEGIAELHLRGGVDALRSAREQVESWDPTLRTDDNVAELIEGIVVTQVPGSPIDYSQLDEVARKLGFKDGTPEHLEPMLDLMGTTEDTTLVGSTYEPSSLNPEEIRLIREELSEVPSLIAERQITLLKEQVSGGDNDAVGRVQAWERVKELADKGEFGLMMDRIQEFNTDDDPANDIDLEEIRSSYERLVSNFGPTSQYNDPFFDWVIETTDAQRAAMADGATATVPDNTGEALPPPGPQTTSDFRPGDVFIDNKTGRTVIVGSDGVPYYADEVS